MTTPRRNQGSAGCLEGTAERRSSSLPLLRRLERDGLDAAEMARLPVSRPDRIAVLLQQARRDQGAALSVVVLLEPELESIWRHLVRRGEEPEEAESQTISVAWEVVSGRRGARRSSSPSSLANAIWTEVRREAGHRRCHEPDVVALPADFDLPGPEHDRSDGWPGLLCVAVAAGEVTPDQAALVAETRIEGRPLREVADVLGRRYDALRMERRRTEAALRTFALSYSEEGS